MGQIMPAGNARYTAILAGKNGGSGIGLVELFDLDQAAKSKLVNISTRGFVDTGDNVMIGGFIVGGGPAKVLIRGIGPSLAAAGVQGALQDPVLELHNEDGSLVAVSDDWRTDQEAEIIATTVPPPDNRESAMVKTVPSGKYTAVLFGKAETTGVALVEVFNLQ